MSRAVPFLFWVLFAAAAGAATLTNDAKTNEVKKAPLVSKEVYKEIRNVLEKKYVDPKQASAEKLDLIAAESLLESFGDSVQVLSASEVKKEGQDLRPVIAAKAVIPPFIGYIRFNRFDAKAPEALWQLINEMEVKDHVSSLILDLRFVKSEDYAAAAKIASLFLPADLEIFRWEKSGQPEVVKTVAIKDRVTLPMTLLVNQETEGAAEVLAGVLKEQDKVLVIGRSPSAGKAYKTVDQKLSDGKILRFAVEKVKLAKGGDLFQKGVAPDVKLDFPPEKEKEIFAQPFEPPVEFAEKPLFNEAILTGKVPSVLPADVEKELKQRVVPPSNNDVVLQRAIDVLKGIRALGIS